MAQADSTSEPAAGRAHGVLVVEDEAILRMMVAEHLRSKGYRVIEAASLNEAVAVLSSGEPADIVFSDVNLSGSLGGLSLTVWVREHFPAVPVILTSGNKSVIERIRGGDPVPFIPKPYDPEQVERSIRRTLSGQSAEK
jgi:DNA-binding NtrC family response regulator